MFAARINETPPGCFKLALTRRSTHDAVGVVVPSGLKKTHYHDAVGFSMFGSANFTASLNYLYMEDQWPEFLGQTTIAAPANGVPLLGRPFGLSTLAQS